MKLYISLAVILLACITTPVLPQRWMREQQQQQQQQAQYCVTSANYYGSCVTLSSCPQITNVVNTVNQRQGQQYIILSQRACGARSPNGEPVVCCTRPLSVPQTTNEPFQSTTSNDPLFSNTKPQTQPQTHPPPTSGPTTNAYCLGPDKKEGNCIPIQECQVLLDELQRKQRDETLTRYLRTSNTICGGSSTNVCCPTSTQSTILLQNSNEIPRRLPTVDEGCGFSNNSYRKIIGGEVSNKGAWPWIALIGYNDELSSSPFKCGGTLITARHVITAAHCLKNDLTFVRLGEHDLTTDTEARHVDIRVVRTEKHPDYNRRNGHSDIAILYLESNVDFTEFISPICMPAVQEFRQKSYTSYLPFVVGWGKTMEGGSSSNVLQELQIPVYDNQVCRDKYKQQKRLFTENQFDNAVLCAGVLSGGKDTCQGDSGGPLMIPESYGTDVRFYLIGVVSYGIGCGRPQIPGVYSSTQHFMDWITEKIADTP